MSDTTQRAPLSAAIEKEREAGDTLRRDYGAAIFACPCDMCKEKREPVTTARAATDEAVARVERALRVALTVAERECTVAAWEKIIRAVEEVAGITEQPFTTGGASDE